MVLNLGGHKYTFYSRLPKNWEGGRAPLVLMNGRPLLSKWTPITVRINVTRGIQPDS